jgi:hypothetical protein
MKAQPYSNQENELVSAAYVRLVLAQFKAEKLTKSHLVAELVAATGRSRGSIESKFMNYSSAAVDKGLLPGLPNGFVKGYKPASNSQKGLADYLIVALARALIHDVDGSAVLKAA